MDTKNGKITGWERAPMILGQVPRAAKTAYELVANLPKGSSGSQISSDSIACKPTWRLHP